MRIDRITPIEMDNMKNIQIKNTVNKPFTREIGEASI